jgi:7-keto-8-aminopelargonate synthetase-like enzyme
MGSQSTDALISYLSSNPKLQRLLELLHTPSADTLKFLPIENFKDRTLTINGRAILNFGNGNYLGLDHHPKVLAAIFQATEKFGSHYGSARVFYTHEDYLALEREIAAFMQAPAALVNVNVAQVHQGAILALFGNPHTHIFLDIHAHTSMQTASLAAQARGAIVKSIDSRNLKSLERRLQASEAPFKVLMIDGVYSMQGEVLAIDKLSALCEKYGCLLYIDDAHGTGILGERGAGVQEVFNLTYDNAIIVGRLQKGLATFGGFLAGKNEIVDILRASSATYIFSGPLQPSAVAAARAAIRICTSLEGKELRRDLLEKSAWMRTELRSLGFAVPNDASPIIPVFIGSDIETLTAGRFLFERGFYVNSVLHPAVPAGKGILRISVNTRHSYLDLQRLAEAFAELFAQLHRWTDVSESYSSITPF